MTLTPSVRAISLCSFPRAAKSFACASLVAISALECLFFLAIAACIRPSHILLRQIFWCAVGANPLFLGRGQPFIAAQINMRDGALLGMNVIPVYNIGQVQMSVTVCE